MKNKMVTRMTAMGLAAIMAIGAVGCGSKAEAPAADAPADAPADDAADAEEPKAEESADDAAAATGDYEPCTLTISWWGGDSRHEATQKALEAFEAAYPGITVEPTFGAWDGWEEKMATAFAAGTAQDVNQINWNWITQYDGDGSAFLDLNQYTDQIDMTQFVNPAYLEVCQSAGTQAALPVSMTGRIFYWDKTSFDEVGIDVPKSYADLLAAGEAFKNYDENYYPLSLGEFDRMILMVYYLESVYGKNWVVDGELQYSQEEIEAGLQFIKDLEDKHVIPTIAKIAGDGAASLDQNQNWIDGHYAGIFEWDSSAKKFNDALAEGRELVVGDYFADFGDYQGGYTKVSMCWAISAKSEHPKEAALLVNYLMNDAEAAKILSSERGIPISKVALETTTNEKLLNETTAEANGKVLDWCQYSLDPKFEDSQLKSSDGVYYDVMAGLSYGDYDISEAASTLIDGINGVLQQ